MSTIHKGIPLESIKAGDVLLCYIANDHPVFERIREATGSKYTHAAFCIGDGMVGHATPPRVEIKPLKDVVEASDHVAVFRQPDAWDPVKIQRLSVFVNEAVARGAKYDSAGLRHFEANKELHTNTLHDRLTQFHEGTLPPESTEANGYTCSGFLAAGFRATGFFDRSASLLYNPDATAPGDLGRDPSWGTFVGYVSLKDGYDIPLDDEFYNESTFAEIWEDASE
jgi:hypothetical protein